MKNLKRFFYEEEAMGTLEVILIATILIGAALIFKDKLKDVINGFMGNLESEGNKAIES